MKSTFKIFQLFHVLNVLKLLLTPRFQKFPLWNSFNQDFQGVVLAYEDERVMSRKGLVHPYFPLIRLTVSATFTIFTPQVGERLLGVVNKIAEEYIGLLVLGFINVAIAGGDIRADLAPKLLDGVWASKKDPSHVIGLSDSVIFRVKSLREDGEFLALLGSLVEPDTGNASVLKEVVGKMEKKRRRHGKDKETTKLSKRGGGKRTREEFGEEKAAKPRKMEEGGRKEKRKHAENAPRIGGADQKHNSTEKSKERRKRKKKEEDI